MGEIAMGCSMSGPIPATQWLQHSLCRPTSTRATRFWGPEPLNPSAWQAFSARLDVRCEVDLLRAYMDDVRSILDVGGGLGTITKHLPCRGRRCVVVDPSARDEQKTLQASDGGVIELRHGRAEQLPIDEADKFDFVLATWVLQYTDDPRRAVQEMVRAVDAEKGVICLVQAHPDNPVLLSYNRCSMFLGRPVADHGFLLSLAANELEEAGYQVSLEAAPASLRASSDDGTSDIQALADIIARLHFSDDSQLLDLKQIALETIKLHVDSNSNTLSDDGVLLRASRL